MSKKKKKRKKNKKGNYVINMNEFNLRMMRATMHPNFRTGAHSDKRDKPRDKSYKKNWDD